MTASFQGSLAHQCAKEEQNLRLLNDAFVGKVEGLRGEHRTLLLEIAHAFEERAKEKLRKQMDHG